MRMDITVTARRRVGLVAMVVGDLCFMKEMMMMKSRHKGTRVDLGSCRLVSLQMRRWDLGAISAHTACKQQDERSKTMTSLQTSSNQIGSQRDNRQATDNIAVDTKLLHGMHTCIPSAFSTKKDFYLSLALLVCPLLLL